MFCRTSRISFLLLAVLVVVVMGVGRDMFARRRQQLEQKRRRREAFRDHILGNRRFETGQQNQNQEENENVEVDDELRTLSATLSDYERDCQIEEEGLLCCDVGGKVSVTEFEKLTAELEGSTQFCAREDSGIVKIEEKLVRKGGIYGQVMGIIFQVEYSKLNAEPNQETESTEPKQEELVSINPQVCYTTPHGVVKCLNLILSNEENEQQQQLNELEKEEEQEDEHEEDDLKNWETEITKFSHDCKFSNEQRTFFDDSEDTITNYIRSSICCTFSGELSVFSRSISTHLIEGSYEFCFQLDERNGTLKIAEKLIRHPIYGFLGLNFVVDIEQDRVNDTNVTRTHEDDDKFVIEMKVSPKICYFVPHKDDQDCFRVRKKEGEEDEYEEITIRVIEQKDDGKEEEENEEENEVYDDEEEKCVAEETENEENLNVVL